MQFNPQSRATWTDRMASSSDTFPNSCPSDEAPKLRLGSWRPVLPRVRICMDTSLPELTNGVAPKLKKLFGLGRDYLTNAVRLGRERLRRALISPLGVRWSTGD